MKICVFDTETSGFPKRGDNFTYEDTQGIGACRCMQIALMCFDTDNVENNYLTYSSYMAHVDPYDVHPGALKAHRISREYAQSVGISCEDVLPLVTDVFESVDALAGHNVQFDIDVLRMEALRYGSEHLMDILKDHSWICTMNDMTDVCKLPKASSYHKQNFKFPRLEECVSFVRHGHCDVGFGDEGHDALFDLNATKEVIMWLMSRPKHVT